MTETHLGGPARGARVGAWVRRWWLGLAGMILVFGSLPVCVAISKATTGPADFGWFAYQPLPSTTWNVYVDPQMLLLGFLLSFAGLLLTVGVVSYRVGVMRARRRIAPNRRNDSEQS